MNHDPIHTAFQASLWASQVACEVIFNWLVSKGNTVYMPPLRVAPTRANWRDYSDGGDLFVTRPSGQVRIEVKRSSFNWTGPNDWPHRGRFIICSVRPFDRADPPVRGLFRVSDNLRYCAWTDATDRKGWWRKKVYDKRYKESQLCYLARPEAMTWIKLPDPAESVTSLVAGHCPYV